MAGAAARSEQLDAIADNLANSETPGFKASRPAFQSFLASAGQTDKVFTAAVATNIDMTPGNAVVTDNPLDVLPEGNLFMAVRSGLNQVAYTRNGQLKVGENNVITSDNHPLLGINGEPITIPFQTMATITNDGTVLADNQVVGQIALYSLQGNVRRIGGALYGPAAGGTATVVPNAAFKIGEIETGNATPLEATVAMITAQRNFESAMQAITTYRRMDDRALELGRVR